MDPALAFEVAGEAQSRTINEVIERGDSAVQQCYAGAVIFITGGSGFLGKQLIEKLLRTCEIEKIYILLRPKKNKTIDERLERLANDPVFEKLRTKKPEFHKKIIPVEGDVSKLELGISPGVRRMVTEQVTIIIHAAATINFVKHLKLATITNVRGTREVLNLGKDCRNIKSFVHISTAYSHATVSRINQEILEQFYECPMLPETLIDFVERYDDEQLKVMTPHLFKTWPNTYAFTKAVAEEAVRSMSGDLPICIVRPAIVMGALRDPTAGWMDESLAFGTVGYVIGVGMGVMRLMYAKKETHLSVVPVDLVNNTVITAAHETVVRRQQGHTDIKIYNVSSTRNPITLGKLTEFTLKAIRQFPTDKALYHVSLIITSNKPLFRALTWLTAYIPAYIADGLSRLAGKQTQSESEYRRLKSSAAGRAAAVAVLDSEPEVESEIEEVPRAKKQRVVKSAPRKEKDQKKKLSGKSKPSTSVANDLFGEETEQPTAAKTPPPLWSSLTRRVADGTLRQATLLDGSFFFDIRVYNTGDIINLPVRERPDHTSAHLRLQVEPDDPLWIMIKNIFKEGKGRFDKEAVFYANKK